MNAKFKPLGLAAAVAAASAGYAGITQAATTVNGLGDLAIVPYYSVQGANKTGIVITNTSSDYTQVVKLRLRRASDSMDALDFNIILSPEDVWAGTVMKNDEGVVVVKTQDNSCTAPIQADGEFEMPGATSGISFRNGAEEGYIEVIGMGQAGPGEPISIAALHGGNGVPASCSSVESNFFRNASWDGVVVTNSPGVKGILGSDESHQVGSISGHNTYMSSGNTLRVSYFIRDDDSGLEMGDDAVHIADFSADAMMSNQEVIQEGNYDAFGFVYPDLNGGSPADTVRDRYNSVIRADLGVASVLNDWSTNPTTNVSTDWVITFPGQYSMVRFDEFAAANADSPSGNCTRAEGCDNRDIPVTAFFNVTDREEQKGPEPESSLVISPATTAAPLSTLLTREVNVIEWTNGSNDPVLGAASPLQVEPVGLDQPFGWAELSVTSSPGTDVCIVTNIVDGNGVWTCAPAVGNVPMVGFTAWERVFPSSPDANYGRIIEHASTTASS